jgi:HEAT repeat protein
MPSLLSSDDQRALETAQGLAEQGADGVPGLLALFAHRSWTVRRGVVSALAQSDRPSLELLTRALVDDRKHEPTIAGIVDALSAASSDASALVSELLQDANPAVLCDAIQILGRRREHDSVPRLAELTQHVDDNVALAAVEALGRIGGTKAVDQLIALAEGTNFFRVFPAIEGLGRSRDVRALPTLQKLLKQPIYAAEAARAMGRSGSISAVAPLMKILDGAPESLLRIVALSLSAIHDALVQNVGTTSAVRRVVRECAGDSLRERVTRALGAADSVEGIALGRLLVWLADEESVADFIPLLNGTDEVAALAVEGLSELSALADPRVLNELASGSSQVRARLLPALMGIAAADAAVVACLDDEQASVRALACHALARGSSIGAVPRLFELLLDSDLGVVHAAVSAIQSLGSEETQRLALSAARSPNLAERRAALRIVMYFGYPEGFDLSLEALGSNDERLREIALSGLPALDDPRVTSLLIEAAGHGSARTRSAALRALGHVAATPETAQVLRTALDDPDAWVRYYACQSLGRLRIDAALPLLVAKLQDPAGQVQTAAVEALAAIPGPAATEALSIAAASANLDVRRAAVVGIGERKDGALRGLLLNALMSADSALRMVALSSLARLEDPEAELERVALGDRDAVVQRAAIELLANRATEAATQALIHVLERDSSSKEAVTALGQNIEARVSYVLAQLERADDALARVLLMALSRAEPRVYRAALDTAFASPNARTRAATARVFSLLADDAAKASLARAATLDADPEVRRICAAAIA